VARAPRLGALAKYPSAPIETTVRAFIDRELANVGPSARSLVATSISASTRIDIETTLTKLEIEQSMSVVDRVLLQGTVEHLRLLLDAEQPDVVEVGRTLKDLREHALALGLGVTGSLIANQLTHIFPGCADATLHTSAELAPCRRRRLERRRNSPASRRHA